MDNPSKDRDPQVPREISRSDFPVGRAAFFGMIAAGIGAIAVAPSLSGKVNRAAALAVPESVSDAVSGGGWRIYNVAPPMPTFSPATYALEIGGLVERPTTLTWPEVAATPGDEQVSDFHCVTGWSVYDVAWEGLRPKAIVTMVKPRPNARYVTFFSLEAPYVDQITLDQFLLDDVLLARTMDGRPLKRVHGSPLRVIIPQMYGYKGVKWLSGIRFDAEPGLGFWEQRGYDVNAWVGRSNGIDA